MNRGDSFRTEFSNIGEVRSLLPNGVHLMALTATATKQTREDICRTLGMINPVVIADSPNKPNIKYSVVRNPGTLEETFESLIEEVRKNRQLTERTIIFCRTYDSCARIYMFMKYQLRHESTEPIGAPDIGQFRLVDMFCSCTEEIVKNDILMAFSSPNSNLRIVIATIAFGMGLDCPNVRRIIHWGPSDDIELYMQETGRGGRDMAPAQALLYYGGPNLVVRHVDESMKIYCANTEVCRRKLLLKHFDDIVMSGSTILCCCCDVCELKCKCDVCTGKKL